MTTIGTAANIMDFMRREDADGNIAMIAELLHKQNEILRDMQWVEGNLPVGHKTTVRTGLPAVTWRKLNYGVQPSKSTTKQVTDTCGMLEAYGEVDKALADLNNNSAAWRLSEEQGFIEAMNQEMASTLFYGDTDTNDEEFLGLTPRFDTADDDLDVSGSQIINADSGGSGANQTSVWLLVWGPNTVHGIFPKGSQAGLMSEDLGRVTLTDDAGGLYEGYRTHYKWDLGLTVRNWKYIVRIANVDVTRLKTDAASGANLIDAMISATERIPNLGMGTPAFYCNKTIRSFLRKQIINKTNVNLTWDTVEGQRVLAFDDIPVRKCDAILNTEAVVTGDFAID